MRIATFNVNGINARLPSLVRWLTETAPDVACLQELKTPHERFPEQEVEKAGYRSIWHGQKSWNGVAILARGVKPIERRRALPGDLTDSHSRYVEAAVGGLIVGCLYLPNGNPAPGPKFDYKLRWIERLQLHATALVESNEPAILAGDFNIIPADLGFASALIFAISGYARESDVEVSCAAGFDRHLSKPVDLEQLISALASL